MFLREYITNITETINEFTITGLILSSELITDIRTDKIGFIKGKIIFLNESTLFFKEYLDLRYKIDKKTYSFHYQDKDFTLIFRYDNALHKPDPGFINHKHISNNILPSDVPTLSDIFEEIVSKYLTK